MSIVLWEAAELGRLLHTHRLGASIVAAALELDEEVARELLECEASPIAPRVDQVRLALTLNILIRLEVRCCYDSTAMAIALERPVKELGGASIADRLRRPIAITGLRQLRDAAGSVTIAKVKMWRVADGYS